MPRIARRPMVWKGRTMRSVLSPVRRRRWVSAGACLIPLLSVLVWGGGAAAALPISDSAEPLVADEAGYQRPGETERVSVASDGSEAEGSSVAPLGMDISADGRFVAFSSPAPNLVSGDTNGAVDVFVHDRATGATERVSVTSDANQGFHEDGYMYPSISDDGRYVAFCGDELLPGDASSALVYVHDRESRTTERIGPGCFPQLSADGRFLLAKPVGKPPGCTIGRPASAKCCL